MIFICILDMVKYFNLNRKVIAYKTTESWTSVPHVSFIYEADVTKALQVLKTVNEQSGIHITLNTLMLKIFTEAIKAAPQINAHIKYNPGCISGKIEYKKQVNISVPLLLANQEMVTINLLGFENKSLTQMQEYIDRTKEKIENCNIEIPLYRVCIENLKSDFKNGHFLKVLGAIVGTIIGKSKTSKPKKDEIRKYNKIPAENKILPRDLVPGTITISNLGSLYKNLKGYMTLLEIIPPQVCAIGIGAVQEKAGILIKKDKKEIGIKSILPVCIVFDHRALNFNEVIPFIKKLDEIFEHCHMQRH